MASQPNPLRTPRFSSMELGVAVLVAAAVGAVLGASWARRAPAQAVIGAGPSPGPAVRHELPPEQEPAAVPPTPPAAPDSSESEAPDSGAPEAEVDCPVALEPSLQSDGLQLDVRLSRLNNYPDSSYYTLHALLRNSRPTEISKLGLRLEMLDRRGTVLGAESFNAPDTYQAPLRPGDAQVVEQLVKASPAMKSARLRVQLADKTAAAGQYAPARPVELEWAVSKPERVPIEVSERSAATSANPLFNELSYDAVFEIRNVGQGSLRTLKLEQRFFDAAGTQLKAQSFLVVVYGGTTMLPGEMRTYRSLAGLPTNYDHNKLVVLEVQ
jgi:hypothetical protein